jgi:hypothetical protein
MPSADNDESDSYPNKPLLVNSTIENTTGAISTIDNPTGLDGDKILSIFSIKKIYKNLFVLASALVLLFTAYTNIGTLQSSLNAKHNVGMNSLIINNACIIVSSTCEFIINKYMFCLFFQFSAIFITSSFLDIFGLKWSIILGEVAHVFYILANIHPLPSLMYISR